MGDLSSISTFIGTLGFPIFMCILMYIQTDKQNKAHAEEINKLTESVNNNTIALTKLTAELEGEKNC